MASRPPMTRLASAAGVLFLAAALLGCQQGDSASASSTGPSAASAVDALKSAVVDTRPLPPATVAAMAPASAAPASSMPTVGDVPPPPMLPGAASAAGSSSALQLPAVRSQLDRLLTQAASCNTDSECRTVATGGKACGGPTGYRAYSVNGADPATVAAVAQRERDLSLVESRHSGRVSACFMLADPGAHCQAKTCVTGPAGGAGGVSTR